MMCHPGEISILNCFVALGLIMWFVIASVLMLNRLDKIVALLSKK